MDHAISFLTFLGFVTYIKFGVSKANFLFKKKNFSIKVCYFSLAHAIKTIMFKMKNKELHRFHKMTLQPKKMTFHVKKNCFPRNPCST